MIKVFEEFLKTKLKDIEIVCNHCQNPFRIKRKRARSAIRAIKKLGHVNSGKFCSHKCASDAEWANRSKFNCCFCDKEVYRKPCDVLHSLSKRFFCSSSCSVSFQNKNKKYGTRCSKLERYIQDIILKEFPKLDVEFNNRSQIGYELDLYFPSLGKAVEFNGIFHYKPIFGEEKLQRIKENDFKRAEECKVQNIQLLVLDISYIKQFNVIDGRITYQKILDFIRMPRF